MTEIQEGTYKLGRWEYPAERYADTGDIRYMVAGEARWGIDQSKFTPLPQGGQSA